MPLDSRSVANQRRHMTFPCSSEVRTGMARSRLTPEPSPQSLSLGHSSEQPPALHQYCITCRPAMLLYYAPASRRRNSSSLGQQLTPTFRGRYVGQSAAAHGSKLIHSIISRNELAAWPKLSCRVQVKSMSAQKPSLSCHWSNDRKRASKHRCRCDQINRQPCLALLVPSSRKARREEVLKKYETGC